MTGRDVYKKWAPAGVRWTEWVRPVPFVSMDYSYLDGGLSEHTTPVIGYANGCSMDTAIIVDLPGAESVKEGIALARLGFRPIPVYNGTSGQEGAMAIVDTLAIENALKWGAGELEGIKIADNAPPAFLLDSNRTHRLKMNASVFDNSWDIYDQDLPTAEYLMGKDIRRIVVRGVKMQTDLIKILFKFQGKGITIHYTDGYAKPSAIVLKAPSRKTDDLA